MWIFSIVNTTVRYDTQLVDSEDAEIGFRRMSMWRNNLHGGRGARWAAVHGVTKSRARLSDWTTIIWRFWTAWRFSPPNSGVAQCSTTFCNKRKISYFFKLPIGSLVNTVPVSLTLRPKATYTLAHSSISSLFVLVFLAVYHFRYLWWISNDSTLLFTCNLIPPFYVKLTVNVRSLDKTYMFPVKTLLPICFGT